MNRDGAVNLSIPTISKDTPFIVGLATDWRRIFFTYRGKYSYPLNEQVYILMKRLRQQYSEIMSMPKDVRLFVFRKEMEVIEKEIADANKHKG